MNDFKWLPIADEPVYTHLVHDLTESGAYGNGRRRQYAEVTLDDGNVRAAVCGKQEHWIRDAVCEFLFLRTYPTGGKSFYFVSSAKYLLHAKRVHLGDVPGCSVELARLRANRELTAILGRKDQPTKERRLNRRLRISEVVQEYHREDPAQASEWSKRKEFLLATHVVPNFGGTWLSGVTRSQWETVIDDVILRHRSQGDHLAKTLKHFLSWAVRRGLLQANPLARYKPNLPFRDNPTAYVNRKSLIVIWLAARTLGYPWSAMIGLLLHTGEAIEHIRRIKGTDIDWHNALWNISWNFGECDPYKSVYLGDETLEILAPYRCTRGFLFPSPRSLVTERPINFYAEVIDQLKKLSGTANWGVRDLRHAVQDHISRHNDSKYGVALWAREFTAELASFERGESEGMDEVML